MFSSDRKQVVHNGRNISLALRSTEIIVMGMNAKGKLKICARKYLDSEYILCQRSRAGQRKNQDIKPDPPSVKQTLIDMIANYDSNKMEINLDNTIVESGRLEEILEESSANEEVASFMVNNTEYMLVLRKPCIEYFDEERECVILLYPM